MCAAPTECSAASSGSHSTSACLPANYLAGVISGSIAITADAFNNLSDAGSSFISLVGFQIFRHEGRCGPSVPDTVGIEYVSGFGDSMIIILMGFGFKDIGQEDLSSGTGRDKHSGGRNPHCLYLREGIYVLL